MTEGQKLDALTLDEAKGILAQLRFFSDDTLFVSLRFTEMEFARFADAMATTDRSPEEFISMLCEYHLSTVLAQETAGEMG